MLKLSVAKWSRRLLAHIQRHVMPESTKHEELIRKRDVLCQSRMNKRHFFSSTIKHNPPGRPRLCNPKKLYVYFSLHEESFSRKVATKSICDVLN